MLKIKKYNHQIFFEFKAEGQAWLNWTRAVRNLLLGFPKSQASDNKSSWFVISYKSKKIDLRNEILDRESCCFDV